MAGISDEDIQKVRDASDLVAVIGERTPVKQKGRDFWCCCPLHQEKTPSFKIDPATQLWHCFGCGEGGDVFSFIMKTEDFNFPEAVRYLADRARIDIAEDTRGGGVSRSVKSRMKEICARTAEFYHTQLMRGRGEGPDAARKYLASRGFGGEVPKKWMLGYAPGRGALVRHLSALGFKPDEMIRANVALDGRGGPVRDRFYERVMFPIFDAQGDCVAFGGRVIGAGEPKYLNSQETPLFHKSQVLYGLDQAKARMASTGCAIVVEGYTDVIALHEAGVTNVVATLGTALTMRHIRVLAKHAPKKIVYLFDGDAAGQKAADRALAFIGESISDKNRNSVELLAVTLPSNQDPAEFVQAEGAQALEAVVEGALPLIEFGLERRLDSFDLDTAPGRDRALDACLAVLAPIKDTLVAKDYVVRTWSRLRAHGRLGIEEAEELEGVLLNSASFYDLASENSYHMLLVGLLFGVPGYGNPVSNREAGRGRFDIRLVPERAGLPTVTLELKFERGADTGRLEALAAEALAQIEARAYDAGATESGAGSLRYGIAFSGKSLAVAADRRPS